MTSPRPIGHSAEATKRASTQPVALAQSIQASGDLFDGDATANTKRKAPSHPDTPRTKAIKPSTPQAKAEAAELKALKAQLAAKKEEVDSLKKSQVNKEQAQQAAKEKEAERLKKIEMEKELAAKKEAEKRRKIQLEKDLEKQQDEVMKHVGKKCDCPEGSNCLEYFQRINIGWKAWHGKAAPPFNEFCRFHFPWDQLNDDTPYTQFQLIGVLGKLKKDNPDVHEAVKDVTELLLLMGIDPEKAVLEKEAMTEEYGFHNIMRASPMHCETTVMIRLSQQRVSICWKHIDEMRYHIMFIQDGPRNCEWMLQEPNDAEVIALICSLW